MLRERGVSGQGTWRRGYNGRADIQLIEWDGRRTVGNASVTFRSDR